MRRMARKSNNQLQQLVDEFVSQLSVLVHQSALDVVREALGDSPAPAKRKGPGRPAKAKTAAAPRRKASKRGRRSADEVEALGTVVMTHVRSNAGQRLEEMGRALAMPTKELKRPIAKLLEAGALRTEGQRRGTKYFAGGRKAAAGAKKAGGKKASRKKATRKAGKKATTKRKTRKKTAKRK